MAYLEDHRISRQKIGFRLLFTLLYFIVFEVLKLVIQACVVIQYIFLLIFQRPSEPLRSFSNKLAAYLYQVVRYMTVNDGVKPFPFTDLPPEKDAPETPAYFE